jgi:diadenosine tetraphosphate (Ap4A) HIT family hydrolase
VSALGEPVTITPFVLDARLEADTFVLGQWDLCCVLLMNDARYPWLVLVPQRPDLTEIIDLVEAERSQLMREIALASEALKAVYAPDKLNIGALGNHVRQLHVHVLARFVSDAAWPGPVWGVGNAQNYPPHMAGVVMDRIVDALTHRGMKASLS